MIFLNINNIEEIVFTDKKVRELFPSYKYLFDSFDLSKVSPALKQLGVRCFNDFLKKVTKEEIKNLENYLNDSVEVELLNLDLTKNINSNIDEIEFELPNNYNNIDLTIYRKGKDIKVTLWK